MFVLHMRLSGCTHCHFNMLQQTLTACFTIDFDSLIVNEKQEVSARDGMRPIAALSAVEQSYFVFSCVGLDEDLVRKFTKLLPSG
jgi:hypothetical protein